MRKIKLLLGVASVALLMGAGANSASAVTDVNMTTGNGTPYDLTIVDNRYTYGCSDCSGTATNLQFLFSGNTPQQGQYLITLNRSGDFSGFYAYWSEDTTAGNVGDIDLNVGPVNLAGDPWFISLPMIGGDGYILAGWGTGSNNAGDFDISVNGVIPIPAPILLLLSGLLGLGFLGRRKRISAA